MTPHHDRGAPSSGALTSIAWGLVLILVAVLPTLTASESIEFQAMGQDLNVRFIAYGGAAVALAILAAGLAWRQRLRGLRNVLPVLTFFAWFCFVTILAGQPAREWLPSLLRWILSIAVFAIACMVARGERGEAARGMFLWAVAIGAAVPLAWGAFELASGTAPLMNGARRISGSLVGHPVAFSLVLMVAALLFLPVVLNQTRRRSVRLASAAIVVLAGIELVFTYTRLTLLLGLAGGVVAAVAMAPAHRLRNGALASLISVAIIVIAAPFLISRFEQPTGPPRPVPSTLPGQPSATRVPTPTPRLVLVDNSTKLRIRTHELGVGYIAESPIVGHGAGSFDRLFARDTGMPDVAAHDDLLLYAVEAGLPGLVLLLAAYALALLPLAGWLFDARRDGGFGIAAFIVFGAVNVGAVIHNPTYFPEIQVTVWAALGLASRPRWWLEQRP